MKTFKWLRLSSKLMKVLRENHRLRAIQRQVDDVLAVNWVDLEDDDYTAALVVLVQQAISMHDDPDISEEAANRADHLQYLEQEVNRLRNVELLVQERLSVMSEGLGKACTQLQGG
jgi:hypothetical protein